ncbi:condensation domain-containing protein [Streptomyces sp. NPDC019396]|uniref:condensation domain-containing protein n=1 Tax=Streptomyces sp. NPDC019396 TaxID=3154687 RepID=UPI0033EEBAD2
MDKSCPPVPRRLGARSAPLSYAQERLWFIDASMPGAPTYNVPLFTRWHEPVDPDALEAALTALVARHEILRTTYGTREGVPVQCVGEPWPVPVEVVDLTGVPHAAERAREDAARRAREPFDLAEGPLLRCVVWRGLPDGDAMLLTIHHIAVDGWSLAPVFDDLADAYRQACAGDKPALDELPLQYTDFAVWDRGQADDPELREQLAERARELVRSPARLPLAGRLAGGEPIGSAPGEQIDFQVPQETWTDVCALARTLRATPYVVALAAFQTVLLRWSGRTGFLVGTLTANRPHPSLEELSGFFVNTVPLRCWIEPEDTFSLLCRQVRGEAFRSLSHQRLPFNQLTAAVTEARQEGRSALVDVGFTLQNMPQSGDTARALWHRPVELPTGKAKFDVLMLLEETPDGLRGALEYATDTYPRDVAEGIAEDFRELLAAVVAAPDRTVRELVEGLGGIEPRVAALGEPSSGTARTTADPAEVPEIAVRRAVSLFTTVLAQAGRLRAGEAEPGPASDFFSMGGHSLLAVSMLTEAQRRYGVAVTARAFLADPTVAGLGRLLCVPEAERSPQPVGARADEPGPYPATPVQQRFLFLDRIAEQRAAYVLPTVLECEGPLDRALLRRALEEVLGRHPALRSRFELDRKLRKFVYRTDGSAPEIRETDATHWSDDRLSAHVDELAWTPFDLATEAPARVDVITAGENRTLIVLAVHHAVADGWSARLLTLQTAEVYRAALEDRAPVLADPVHPRLLAPAADDSALAARLAELSGAPVDVALPHDRPRGNRQSTAALSCRVTLDEDLTGRLRTVLDELGCTTFMGAAALLAATLARAGEQRDFLFTFPWAGRETAGADAAVGMFVNTLVLRADLGDGPSWRQLLGRLRRAGTDAYRAADLPFDALAAALHPDRGLDRPPVTPVYLAAVDVPDGTPDFGPGVAVRRRKPHHIHTKYELELTAVADGGRLELNAEYATALFDADTVADLLSSLTASAADLVTDPDAPVIKEK